MQLFALLITSVAFLTTCIGTQSKKGEETTLSTESSAILSPALGNENFIPFGPAGQSRTFNSFITLYIHRSAMQPDCVGCFNLRLVIDDIDKPVEGMPPPPAPEIPRAHKAWFVVPATCNGSTSLYPSSLSSIWRFKGSPRQTQLAIKIDSVQCAGISVKLVLYADKCSTNTIDCREQVVRHSFDVPIASIKNLKPWLEEKYPNLSEKRD